MWALLTFAVVLPLLCSRRLLLEAGCSWSELMVRHDMPLDTQTWIVEQKVSKRVKVMASSKLGDSSKFGDQLELARLHQKIARVSRIRECCVALAHAKLVQDAKLRGLPVPGQPPKRCSVM